METLAKQIEQGMRGEWKQRCFIEETDLEGIWPIDEKDREKKIAKFARNYGFRLMFYRKGLGAMFDKRPWQQRT
jgi:hypothetical protein